MSSDSTSPPKQTYRRFSIRTVLILITLLAVFFGYRTNIARQEAPAIELVSDHGCTPRYRHDIFGNLPSFAPRPLRELVGPEYFGRVIRLNFADGFPKSDEALAKLDCLPAVTVMNTDGSGITDDGLKHISNLQQLEILRLPNARITGAGLRHLSGLSQLSMLDLEGNQIDDDGLVHLLRLHELEFLTLSNTSVTDEGIDKLAKLPALRYLKVRQSP